MSPALTWLSLFRSIVCNIQTPVSVCRAKIEAFEKVSNNKTGSGGREELPKWKWFIVFLSMIVFLFFYLLFISSWKKSLFSRSVCVPTNIIGWPNKRSGKGFFFFWEAKEGKIGWTGKLSRESLLNYRHLEFFLTGKKKTFYNLMKKKVVNFLNFKCGEKRKKRNIES